MINKYVSQLQLKFMDHTAISQYVKCKMQLDYGLYAHCVQEAQHLNLALQPARQ